MPGTKQRVDWTAYEYQTWYAAVVDLVKNRKLELPITPGKGRTAFLKACQDAQISLPANRRRASLSSIDAISKEYKEKFFRDGILPQNVESLKKGYKAAEDEPAEVDPKDTRIAELEGELTAANDAIRVSQEQNGRLMLRIEELEKQPTPAQMMQKFIAETIAMALGMHADRDKPAFVRPEVGQAKKHEDLPQFEKDRRKAYDGDYGGNERRRKPRIAIVADFVGSDTRTINDAVKDHAEMRYLSGSPAQLDGLRTFNADHGRIILWTDHCGHQIENGLKARGVTYSRFSGTLPNLIEQVKKKIIEANQ